MTRSEETRAAKAALRQAGIKAAVSHGRGTAYGWLDVYNAEVPHVENCTCMKAGGGHCSACGLAYRTFCDSVLTVVKAATGRTGYVSIGNVVFDYEKAEA